MSRYSTITSIFLHLPGLDQNNSNTSDIINKHVNNVAGKIDSYVSQKYDVTGWTSASSTPEIIKGISDALSSKRVMMSLFIQDGQNKNAWIKELAKEALEDLHKIADGELVITLNGDEEPTDSEVKSNRENFTPVFAMDDPLNQDVDPDLLDEINSERT